MVNDLRPYGSQRVALLVSVALVKMGHQVRIFTLERSSTDDLKAPGEIRVTSIQRNLKGALGYAQSVARLGKALKQERADLIISHMMFSNVVTLASVLTAGIKTPVVIAEHNVPSKNLGIERSPRALLALARMLYPRAKQLIGVSQAVVEDARILFRLPEDLGTVVLNPVDVAQIRRETAPLPPHAWLTEARATVVCVAAFRHAKGQDLLIRALPLAPEIRAIFVGDGALRADCEALAIELGVQHRVDFVGFRSDASSFIRHASILVVPSRWEGFGLVAVEAAAVGTPVVATGVTGLSELVPQYVPGIRVEPDSPSALAAGIQQVLASPPPSTPDLSPFTPEAVARKYLDSVVELDNRASDSGPDDTMRAHR